VLRRIDVACRGGVSRDGPDLSRRAAGSRSASCAAMRARATTSTSTRWSTTSSPTARRCARRSPRSRRRDPGDRGPRAARGAAGSACRHLALAAAALGSERAPRAPARGRRRRTGKSTVAAELADRLDGRGDRLGSRAQAARGVSPTTRLARALAGRRVHSRAEPSACTRRCSSACVRARRRAAWRSSTPRSHAERGAPQAARFASERGVRVLLRGGALRCGGRARAPGAAAPRTAAIPRTQARSSTPRAHASFEPSTEWPECLRIPVRTDAPAWRAGLPGLAARVRGD
jgi:hypothetical protein